MKVWPWRTDQAKNGGVMPSRKRTLMKVPSSTYCAVLYPTSILRCSYRAAKHVPLEKTPKDSLPEAQRMSVSGLGPMP